MLSLVRLYADIALLRRGPEELPASLFLLLGTVVANFLVNFIVSTLLPPFPGPWHLHLAVDILFTLAWYAVLMRLFARPERFLQTTTAVFGYQTVLAPVWIATAWLAGRFQQDDAWLIPVAPRTHAYWSSITGRVSPAVPIAVNIESATPSNPS